MKEFILITNKVFYKPADDIGAEVDVCILDHINKDGKVILILYYLWHLRSKTNIVETTIERIVELSGYKTIPKNINKFKEIILKLRELNVISFEGDDFNRNTMMIINCNNIIDFDDGCFNFFKLDEEEIDLIRSNSTNNQNFITNLKVYCYLKARVQKIDSDKDISERGYGQAEVTWRSFDDITKHTGVSAVEKSINKLRDIGLIKYVNPGMKQKGESQPINCSNIYALRRVSKNVELELKEGLKQYIYKLENEGWNVIQKDICIRKYQSEGGIKSAIKQKINKGTATKKEINKFIELEEIKKKRHEEKKKQDKEFKRKIGLI